MFEAKKTHSGQYKRYGDSFYEWSIKTDLPKEKVLEKCFKELAKAEYPVYEEWSKNVRPVYEGWSEEERKFDMGYYFHGYYTLNKTENGYSFTVCHPYTD